ncbi:hypothetical protein [Rhizobium sp. No.120]
MSRSVPSTDERKGLLVPLAGSLEQFQQKCEVAFRPELRKNKKIERFRDSKKFRRNAEKLYVAGAGAASRIIMLIRGGSWTYGSIQQFPALKRREKPRTRF